jgi:hypothetical protein
MVTGLTANSYPQVTLNKVSSGVTYPLSVAAVSGYAAGANWPAQETKNLLPGPITLATGESITITANTTPSVIELTSTTLTSTQFTPTNAFYLNSYWILTGNNNITGQAVINYSTDGVTWTESALGWWNKYPRTMAFGNGYYIVTSAGLDDIYYATNIAGPWTAVSVTAATNAGVNGLAYAAGRFIILAANGIYVSPSNVPTSFSVLPWGQYYAWYDCKEIGGKAVFTGSNGTQIGATSDFVNFSGFGVYTSALYAYNIDGNYSQFPVAIDQSTGNYFVKITSVTQGATAGSPCALRSTDGGVTWSAVSGIPSSGYSYGSVPGIAQTYLISGANNAHHTVIDNGNGANGRANYAYSSDNGSTWTAGSTAAFYAGVWVNGSVVYTAVFPGSNYVLAVRNNIEPFAIYTIGATGLTQVFTSGGSGGRYWMYANRVPQIAYKASTGYYYMTGWDNGAGSSYIMYSNTPTTSWNFMGTTGVGNTITGFCTRSGSGFIYGLNGVLNTSTSDTSLSVVYTYSMPGGSEITSIWRQGSTIFAANNGGYVARSTDDGVTWTIVGGQYTVADGNISVYLSGKLNYDTTRSRYICTNTGANTGAYVQQSTNGATWTGWFTTVGGGYKLASTANFIYLCGNSTDKAMRIPISGATGSQIPVSYSSMPSANKWRVNSSSGQANQIVNIGTTLYSNYSSNPSSSFAVNATDASVATQAYGFPATGINGLKYLELGAGGVAGFVIATNGSSILLANYNSNDSTLNSGYAVVGIPTSTSNILGAGAVTLGVVEQS